MKLFSFVLQKKMLASQEKLESDYKKSIIEILSFAN
jgi:hypothetical protein